MMWVSRWVYAVLAGAIVVACGMAQANPVGVNQLTIEDVLRRRIPSNPVLSAGGRRVAFLVREYDFEKSRAVTSLWWVARCAGF